MKITKITCENIPAITTVFGLIVTYTTKISNLEYMHVYMWVSISVYKCKCLRIGNINNIHLFTTCCCWFFFLPLLYFLSSITLSMWHCQSHSCCCYFSFSSILYELLVKWSLGNSCCFSVATFTVFLYLNEDYMSKRVRLSCVCHTTWLVGCRYCSVRWLYDYLV